MKALIYSDLHLDFSNYQITKNVQDEEDTVLVLAGDICVAKKPNTFSDFLQQLTQRKFKHIFHVYGNHEHYRGSIVRTDDKIKEQYATFEIKNVSCGDMFYTVLDGVAFTGATLWTSMNNDDWFVKHAAKDRMNDYSVIRSGSKLDPYARKLSVNETITFNHKHFEFIKFKTELANQSGLKNVVITHHAPSFKSQAGRFSEQLLDHCYYNNYDNYICDSSIKLWIHGHTHESVDYTINECRIVSNPRGYNYRTDSKQGNPDFIDDFIIQI
jgi:predicted phosphodiesterase